MNIYHAFSIILLLIAVKTSSVLSVLSKTLGVDNVTVQTDCGLLRGQHNVSYVFRGIPYALPPTDYRRWNQPMPIGKLTGNCWNGTYDAIEFGNMCVQLDPYGTVLGDEDCLYLNVWTPKIGSKELLPVMVYIHGGGLLTGSGHSDNFSPTEELARDTNIVYVSMNYRLNAFGFMSLRILSEASPRNTSGNYGFMDQIIALEWVQRNIRAFSGDPYQVTVFGHDSGGTSVLALLSSPLAAGLFSKAWMLSASPVLNITTAKASRDNRLFLQNSGCTNVECLHKLPVIDILQAIPRDIYPYWGTSDQWDVPTNGTFEGGIAVVDGYVVPHPLLTTWRLGIGNPVPLMIGTTAQEIDFAPKQKSLKSWSWTDYEEHINKTLGTFGDDIAAVALEFYPTNTSTPEFQYTSLASDIRMNCPTDYLALYAWAYLNKKVFRYIVTSVPSKPVNVSGFASEYSFHSWDLLAYFGTTKNFIAPNRSDLAFQENIRREVLSFVRTGKPYSKDWDIIEYATMLLSETSTVTDEYHRYPCITWEFLTPLSKYPWVN